MAERPPCHYDIWHLWVTLVLLPALVLPALTLPPMVLSSSFQHILLQSDSMEILLLSGRRLTTRR